MRKPRRGTITIVAFAASLVSTAALAWASWGAGALNADIRIDPSTQHVRPGDTFTINMVSNGDVQTTGVEADLTFDPVALEVVDIAPSPTDWQGAAFFLGVAPQGKAEALAEANTTGSLLNIGRYISPGGTPIAAGPRVFAIITMRARTGAPLATVPLRLSGLSALDADYNGVHTSEGEGQVVVTDVIPTATVPGAATSTNTTTPTPSITSTSTPVVPTSTATVGVDTATPTGSPTLEPTETPGPGEPGVIRIDPESQSVNDGDTFNTSIIQFVELAMFGIQSDVTFNPALLQLVSVSGGSGYPTGQLSAGTTGQTIAEAIAEANQTGTLKNLQVFQSESAIGGGENQAFGLVFQARDGVSGLSPIGLKNVFFYGIEAVSVTRVGGLVEVLGPPVTPTFTPTTPATSTHTPTPTATVPVPTNTTGPTSTGTVLPSTATPTRTATVPAPTSSATSVPPTATATLPPSSTPQPSATTGAVATNTIAALPSNTPAGATATSPAGSPTTASGATATATTATGGATATATTLASGSPVPSPTVDPASAQATIKMNPPSITAPPGADFTAILVQEAGFVTTGAEADIQFDPTLIQIVSIEKSQAYAKASLLAGVAPQTLPEAIAEANTTGRMKNIGTFFVPGSGSIPAGPAEFVRVVMKASANASNTTTALKLLDLEMLDANGESLTVASADGAVVIQAGAAVPTPPGAGSTVAGTSSAPGAATRLPNAGVSDSFGELNWALLVSLVAMLASGGALVGSLYQKQN